MKPTRWMLPVLAIAAVAGCTDPVSILARLNVVADTLTVYAVNNTPLAVPTALETSVPRVLRAQSSFTIGGTPSLNFDLVFDIDGSGRVVLYPGRTLASAAVVTRPIGLQIATGTFEALQQAPRQGFTVDSSLVAALDAPVVIRSTNAQYCANDFSKEVYSKLVIDSITTASRAIHFRITVDPNCGFRSFLPGIPTV